MDRASEFDKSVAALLADKKALEGDTKRVEALAKVQSAANSVTGNSAKARSKGLLDSFARGMREGADPYIFAGPDLLHHNSDVATYRMGTVSVSVSGLEMLQASDPEELGFVKGAFLKKLYMEANPTVAGRVSRETAQADVGQGVGMPDPGYAGVTPLAHDRQIGVSMQHLSEVLHELAGMASMCWTMPPGHPNAVFDSQRALDAVAHALKRLGV